MAIITQCVFPYFFEICIFYFISATLASHKISKNLSRIIIIPIFSAVATIIENCHLFGDFYTFINILLTLLCLYVLLQISLLDTIFLFIISYLFTIGIQILVMPFLTPKQSILNDYLPLVGNGIIMIISYLIYKKCFKYELYKYIQKSKIIKIILGNLFVVFFSTVCYSKANPNGFYSILILIFLITIFLIILNWDIVISQKKLIEKENEILSYQTYLPVINELIDQVRIRQHQFDNHIQAIGMLPITHKDYNSLADAVINYSSYITISFRNSNLLKINQKLLAGFLFSKCREADEMNRELKILIKNTNIQTIVPEYELINIIGILIDNGIEGVSEGDCVTLVLDSMSNKCFIRLKNKGPVLTNDLRLNMFKKGYTTKKSNRKNHGLGLYNLQQIINEYHGAITVSNESDNLASYIVFEIEI